MSAEGERVSINYPRAWELAGEIDLAVHHPKCSYRQTSGALICDCHVLYQHPETLALGIMYGAGGVIILTDPER